MNQETRNAGTSVSICAICGLRFGFLDKIVRNGSRRHHQLPRCGDGGEGVAAKRNELRRREELLRVLDVVAREWLDISVLLDRAGLEKYRASMMREEEFLTF